MKLCLNTEHISEEDLKFISEMMPYISNHIQNTMLENGHLYVDIEEAYEEEVNEKFASLKEMVIGGKLKGKEIPIQTLTDHTDAPTRNQEQIFPKLLKEKAVFEIADGVYAYSGIVLNMIRYFDAKISQFGKEEFSGITEHEYPVLYPIEKYETGRYFETFPHYIMFQSVMNHDLDTLKRFAENGTSDMSIFDETTRPKNVLRHAACAPLYELLKDTVVPVDKPLVFMVKGRCFRNEADNVFEMARLNEFTMKEYVFIGTPEQCNAGIAHAKQLWEFWQKTLKLNCKVDTANDSFFASNYKKLKLFQILGDSKQEFKWYVPSSDSYIACSSANFHRTHFSKPYHIKNDADTYCDTACFAFGIERMVYAFLSQNGIDPSQWDKEIYNEISRYVLL